MNNFTTNPYYPYGNTYNYSSTTTMPPEVLIFMLVFFLFIIAVGVVLLIASYKLFEKMEMEGWKGLIPMVNTYLTLEKIDVSQKWLLVITFGSCISVIPIIGFLAFLIALIYFSIVYSISLARAFGKSDGFGVGLILFAPIFICILAFDKSKYEGPNPMNDVIFGKKQPSSSLATPIGGSENKSTNNVETFSEEKVEEPVVEEKVEEPVIEESTTVEETTEEKTEEPVVEERLKKLLKKLKKKRKLMNKSSIY